jgi:hypothetical protein
MFSNYHHAMIPVHLSKTGFTWRLNDKDLQEMNLVRLMNVIFVDSFSRRCSKLLNRLRITINTECNTSLGFQNPLQDCSKKICLVKYFRVFFKGIFKNFIKYMCLSYTKIAMSCPIIKRNSFPSVLFKLPLPLHGSPPLTQ